MNLTQARHFLAVAEERHFTRAGQRLGVTQQTVSASIRSIEKAVGTTLFERTPRAVNLTEQGDELLPFVHALVESAERLENEAANLAARTPRSVRIAYTETTGHEVVPSVLEALRAKWPDLDAQAHEVWASELVRQVRDREVDLGLGRCLTPDDTLFTAPVRADGLILVLATDHHLAGRKSVTMTELSGERLVMFPRSLAPGLHDAILSAVDDAGADMRVVASQMLGAAGTSTRLRAVAGVEICARSRRRHPVDGLLMIPIESSAVLTVDVAWDRRATASALRIVSFIRALSQAKSWLDPNTVLSTGDAARGHEVVETERHRTWL